MTVRYGLERSTVLLTGAAGGIGAALAAALVAQGATLVLVDREAAPLDRLVSTLRVTAPVHLRVCELGSDAEVEALATELRASCGRIDVLINNAGVEYPTPLTDADPLTMTRWSALLDNNVVSMVRLTRALLPLMPRGASVINQSSIWGHTGVAGFSAYSASKHAVIGLTRSLAFELAPRGIRVNAVCPGWIRTEPALRSLATMARQRGIDLAAMECEIVARQTVPQMLLPADLAGVFLFLACADSAPLNGQSIVVSHGEVMH